MAHVVDFGEASDAPERSSDITGDRRNNGSRADRDSATRAGVEPHGHATGVAGNDNLAKATNCEESAQRLSSRINEMEDSIRLTRMFLSASSAIEELLVESRLMLEKGRGFSDPLSRKALADTYAIIKNQINDIVAEAEFNDQNLAAGDLIEVAFDETESHAFQIGSNALSISALGLSEHANKLESDAEIIETVVKLEHAINTVKTRRTVTEMALSVLASRAKFARDKVDSLRSTSQFLTEQGKAYGAICEIAASRVARETTPKPNQHRSDEPSMPRGADMPLRRASDRVPEEANVPSGSSERAAPAQVNSIVPATGDISHGEPVDRTYNDELDQLAKELARFLKQGSYLTRWFKYEEGETGTFTHLLSQSYSPELIEETALKYKEDQQFKDLADRYMAKFEAWLDQEVADDEPDRKEKIDAYLKTEPGVIYIALARACGRV
ncbi:MAG: hypothetical protein OEM91_00490 [Hyphomicrobiales bacterium]|nr:hypothetical protein [Hyphomicrobiales bacterium]